MQLRLAYLVIAILIAGLVASTVILFIQGRVIPGVIGTAVFLGLVLCAARASRNRQVSDPAMIAPATLKPANAPPDGHVRFTLVVEGLEPERIAEVWADLCRPDREPSEEFRLLFRNFTVVEGKRFRFQKGDPISTAALLKSVLGVAAGVPVRTTLEPAAERTAPWS